MERALRSVNALTPTFHSSLPIGIYAVVCAVISICSALLLPDRTGKDVTLEAHYGDK